MNPFKRKRIAPQKLWGINKIYTRNNTHNRERGRLMLGVIRNPAHVFIWAILTDQPWAYVKTHSATQLARSSVVHTHTHNMSSQLPRSHPALRWITASPPIFQLAPSTQLRSMGVKHKSWRKLTTPASAAAPRRWIHIYRSASRWWSRWSRSRIPTSSRRRCGCCWWSGCSQCPPTDGRFLFWPW